MNGPINGFNGEYRWLSNFYPCKVECHGLIYPNLEAAYQSCKTLDVHAWHELMGMTGAEAKKAGRLLTVRDSWESNKLRVMEELLASKFSDLNPELKARLLATNDRQIIEDNWWHDYFWGVCGGRGENHLGRLLMERRQHLQQAEASNGLPTCN